MGRRGDPAFEALCREYYEGVLRYLFAALGEESAARDCTQEVFLVALQKQKLLRSHPNPGGFLFQTAKTLAQKARRQAFRKLAREQGGDESPEQEDANGSIDRALDRRIDEEEYVDRVLDRLPPDKRRLYDWYYVGGRSMADIAAELGLQEAALRMRYVRLRREVGEIARRLAEENFYP